MTHHEDDDGAKVEVLPELTITICTDDSKGEYVKLRPGPEDSEPEVEVAVGEAAEEPSSPSRGGSLWYWVKLVVLLLCLGLLLAVFFKWVGPFFMDKVCCLSRMLSSCNRKYRFLYCVPCTFVVGFTRFRKEIM